MGNISAERRLVPLRTFIEYILRRSHATFATLIAACYYLTLLRSSISRQDYTTGQPEYSRTTRPLLCRRRMFTAALILAWKYTQDRHYSLTAWAKISGLHSQEIIANEAVFLETVDWRLFIPHAVFERWARATELIFIARLPDPVLPNDMLLGLEEEPNWPYKLSLLESAQGSVNSDDLTHYGSSSHQAHSCRAPSPSQEICPPRLQTLPSSQSSLSKSA